MAYEPLNFTIKAIESLVAPLAGQRLYYKDTKISNLVLMITDKGVKSFQVYRKINGRPVRVTLGRFPDLSVENARNKAMEANAQISQGKNPNDAKRILRQEITMSELFQQYMTRHVKIRCKSWRNIQARYDGYLSPWSARKLSVLKRMDVEQLIARTAEQSGIHAANSLITLINAMFNKATEWGWDGINPASGVKKFQEKSRDRFLQPHEMPFFFEALDMEPNITARDYILLSLLTGARKSNMLSMRWNEINMEQVERAQWRIPETKNGEPLIIPLSPQAVNILKERRKVATGAWVFPSVASATGHLHDPIKAWRRVLRRAEIYQFIDLLADAEKWSEWRINKAKLDTEIDPATFLQAYRNLAAELELDTSAIGLPDIRIHDLRRSLGSWQAVTGASSYVIGKSLGHKSQQATAIYARLNLDPVRASVERATEAMMLAGKRKNV